MFEFFDDDDDDDDEDDDDDDDDDNINLVWWHFHHVVPYKIQYKLKSVSHVSLTNFPYPFLQGAPLDMVSFTLLECTNMAAD